MKKLKFKQNDFYGFTLEMKNFIILQAQEVFDNWFKENVEDAPIVYSEPIYINKVPVNFTRRCKPEHSLYTAKLICIERIKE